MFKFGARSLKRLEGVHEDLVKVMVEAIRESPYDFSITEGLRTQDRQKQLYDERKSLTLQSRHLTGHAIDFAVWIDGTVTWEFSKYKEVAEHLKKVATTLGVPIIWGGEWRTLKDGPHVELDKRKYP